MRRKPQVVAASMLLALLVLGRESLAQIAVLRVRGTVGEGLQTGYAGSISPGPWREGRSFGRFKSWPRSGADFRLGGKIHFRMGALTYVYLGKLARSLTTHDAEWTAGVHYGSAWLSVDGLGPGEFFRVHTSVAKLVGRSFDAFVRADRVTPTTITVLRGEAILHHRHLTDARPIRLRAGESATVRLDQPVSAPAKLPPEKMRLLAAGMKGLRAGR